MQLFALFDPGQASKLGQPSPSGDETAPLTWTSKINGVAKSCRGPRLRRGVRGVRRALLAPRKTGSEQPAGRVEQHVAEAGLTLREQSLDRLRDDAHGETCSERPLQPASRLGTNALVGPASQREEEDEVYGLACQMVYATRPGRKAQQSRVPSERVFAQCRGRRGG